MDSVASTSLRKFLGESIEKPLEPYLCGASTHAFIFAGEMFPQTPFNFKRQIGHNKVDGKPERHVRDEDHRKKAAGKKQEFLDRRSPRNVDVAAQFFRCVFHPIFSD